MGELALAEQVSAVTVGMYPTERMLYRYGNMLSIGLTDYAGVTNAGAINAVMSRVDPGQNLLENGIAFGASLVTQMVGARILSSAFASADAMESFGPATLQGSSFTGSAVTFGGSGLVAEDSTTVYRVWGGESGAWGRSWTTVDPRTVADYRGIAGLPDANAGRFLSVGTLTNGEGVIGRSALPLDGNVGGLTERIVPSPQTQIQLTNILGLNPEF